MSTNKNNMKPETMLMSGVTVDFPYQPYPCQIAMLGKIIKALQQSKNCLLESPTGTGKTLTLLCAALAWQQKELEQARLASLIDPKDNPSDTPVKPVPISRIFYCTRTHKQLEQVAKQLTNTAYRDKIRMTLLSSRDNYCVHPVVSKGPNKNHECTKLTRPSRETRSQSFRSKSECAFFDRLKGKTSADFLRLTGPKEMPRVFDIEQFTEYCQTTHAVCPYYTSRLLIHDVHLILCPYNYLIDPRVRNSMQMTMNNSVLIIDEAHNIEDCARESMKFDMRKYDFESALDELRVHTQALEMAQIQAAHLLVNASGFSFTQEQVSSTQLPSTQQQVARRASGYSEFDQLNDEMDLLEHLNLDQHGNHQDQPENSVPPDADDHQEVANAMKFLIERFTRIVVWFDSKSPRETHVFTPKELIKQFHQAKFIDRSIVHIHKSAIKTQPATKRGVIQDAGHIRKAIGKCVSNAPDFIKFSDETVYFMENVDLCLSILYADDYKFIDDYKITLKMIPFEPNNNVGTQIQTSSDEPMDTNSSQWVDMSQKSSQYKRFSHNIVKTNYPLHTQQLIFYCLSPSVAFAKDLKLARSLIFASGTLAPLATYSGELKIPFDFQMECNHVIDIQRTFITALSHGRNPQVKLRATYQVVDKTEFQDECGLVVLDVCQRVPYGVLCFVPSYRFLNLIMTRWMSSGLWKNLNEHKSVFFEEKSSANFQNTINSFREANGTLQPAKPLSTTAKRVNAMWKRKNLPQQSSTSNSQYFPIKGGLLLAVCRGRASEGIDFSDNNARCVITLGIPYPNLKDEEVGFKRDYNNEQNKLLSQVMNGSDWYDSQAYRALNQALGRCIRHKNDWGALIIVDERIVNNLQDKQFNNKISLWIKQRLFLSRQYDDTMNALEKFSKSMKKADELAVSEQKQNEQTQEAEIQIKINGGEQRRPSLVVPPPLAEVNRKKVETKPTYRQWNIDDLTDDDNDESISENRVESKKTGAFERFIAQRPISMPAPAEKMDLSEAAHVIDLTDDDEDEDFIRSTPSFSFRPGKKLKSR